MPAPNYKVGLSLSGGGYRATAFHLGTLKKLHEMGILQKVDVLSTISGGSITGAYYATYPGDFPAFFNDLKDGLQKRSVIRSILLSWMGLRFLLAFILFLSTFLFFWTPFPWLFPVAWLLLIILILKFQFQLFPISKRIEQCYDKFFYHGKRLGDLPERPVLVIGATNLQTARPFTFSKYWMQDSTYQFMDDPVKFKPDEFPVSRAVMASSCVPFAFTPISIDPDFFADRGQAKTVHPILVDGGVYDNQGIHKITQQGRYACPIVITSDAGSGASGELSFRNTLSLLLETVNVFMSRIKKASMQRNVYDNVSTANRNIAYFSLGWDAEKCITGFIRNLAKQQIPLDVMDAHQLSMEWREKPLQFEREIAAHLRHRIGYDNIQQPGSDEIKLARSVSTNLTALSKQQVEALIWLAEVLTEIQVKLYCPKI